MSAAALERDHATTYRHPVGDVVAALARSDEPSAFAGMFSNPWLWGALVLSLLLQVAVVHVPFLQQAFSTVGLAPRDWLLCAAVGSSVLWLRELSKGPCARKRHEEAPPAPRAERRSSVRSADVR